MVLRDKIFMHHGRLDSFDIGYAYCRASLLVVCLEGHLSFVLYTKEICTAHPIETPKLLASCAISNKHLYPEMTASIKCRLWHVDVSRLSRGPPHAAKEATDASLLSFLLRLLIFCGRANRSANERGRSAVFFVWS